MNTIFHLSFLFFVVNRGRIFIFSIKASNRHLQEITGACDQLWHTFTRLYDKEGTPLQSPITPAKGSIYRRGTVEKTIKSPNQKHGANILQDINIITSDSVIVIRKNVADLFFYWEL